MKVALVSLFPEMFKALTGYGVSSRAVDRDLLEVRVFNPRDFTKDKHRTVDDRPYGGGPGMLMMIQPLRDAIHAAREWADSPTVVYLSPQGRQFDQHCAERFAKQGDLVMIAGRYEGIDERLIELEVDEEWSIGDYVLSGGELAAMVVLDSVIRLLPGSLGHANSAAEDSFSDGLLDCPHYTRPEMYEGKMVPEVLMSGNHKNIQRWRMKQSLARTKDRRPDLLSKVSLTKEQQLLLEEIDREQG